MIVTTTKKIKPSKGIIKQVTEYLSNVTLRNFLKAYILVCADMKICLKMYSVNIVTYKIKHTVKSIGFLKDLYMYIMHAYTHICIENI